ncbi:hypothetical protein ASE66_02045 [Bosea sp. Root483D1]|uniref:hypothetical protein n=1 Tax=Bosea sp. Root483D1 TaxID=1736544 RepID=UPI00070D29EE|nr:hypothetical protein [Bosea sp. Root483D1]KRE24068.1 hypothetical protein ASE66_02045 [Bosea sp. Root483D1]
MARIEKLEIGPSEGSVHPSKVHARVKVFGDEPNGPIDTFGSADREIPGKLSQTTQLAKTTGQELLAILQRAYG